MFPSVIVWHWSFVWPLSLPSCDMEMIFHSCLSPPQRFLCVVGRLGRKKKRARGERLEGRREKRGLFPPFPSSHCPPRAFYFLDYCYFYRDIQREPLRRRELGLWQSSHADKTHVVHFIGLNLKARVFGSRKWQEVAWWVSWAYVSCR